VAIDRQEIRRVDPQVLPPDAQFKGDVDVIVHDVCFQTDNVRFRKEASYSPSEKRTIWPPCQRATTGSLVRA